MITERLPDGTLVVMTAQGWRPATPEEENASEVGQGEAWAMSGLRGVLDLNNLATLANPFTFMGGGDVRQQAVEQAGGALQERAGMMAPIEAAQPGATAAGAFYADPINAAGMGVGAYRLGRGMLARRVMQQAQQQAGAAAAATAPPGAPAGAGMGPTSVGAASAGGQVEAAAASEQGFLRRVIRAPGQLVDDVQRAIDEFLQPGELTPDQRKMLPVADELGFRFLPGQRQGSAGLTQLATSDPLIQSAFQGELAANRQGLRAAAARAIGINADDFSRDMLGQAAERIGGQLDDVGRQVGSVNLPDDLVRRIETVTSTEPFLEVRAGGVLSGDDAMALRSALNQASRNTWEQGARAPANKAQYIDDVLLELDDLIEAQLTAEQRRAWKVAREQWKNLKVLESPNVTNELGEVNVRSLANQLRRYYKGAYARQVTGEAGRRGGLEPATRQFMDWARLGAQFGDNFPNSGTAYRSRLVQMATNPKELGKSVILRMAIESRLANQATP